MTPEEEKAWISRLTLDDAVLVPDEGDLINVGSNEFTSLESIGGVSSIVLKVKSLIEFIKSNGIKKYKNKNKAALCQLIVQRKIFTKEYRINTNTPLVAQPVPTAADIASTSMNTKKTYSDRPSISTTIGTYFRAINIFFSQKHRADVLALGASIVRPELDERGWPYQQVYESLATTYNSTTIGHSNYHDGCDELSHEHSTFEGISSAVFDRVAAVDFKEIIDHIKFHFKAASTKKTTSGNHDRDFLNYVRTKPYVYYFYLELQKAPGLSDLFDGDVGSAFSEVGVAAEASVLPPTNKKRRYNKQAPAGSADRDVASMVVDGLNAAAKERSDIQRQQAASFLSLMEERKSRDNERLDLEQWCLIKKNLAESRADLRQWKELGYAETSLEVYEAKLEVKFWYRKKNRIYHSVMGTKLPGHPPLPPSPTSSIGSFPKEVAATGSSGDSASISGSIGDSGSGGSGGPPVLSIYDDNDGSAWL
jgi:hypothetical protein